MFFSETAMSQTTFDRFCQASNLLNYLKKFPAIIYKSAYRPFY